MGYARRKGPTPRQVECFQMLVLHRSYVAAGDALGVDQNTVRVAVKGFLRRTR